MVNLTNNISIAIGLIFVNGDITSGDASNGSNTSITLFSGVITGISFGRQARLA